MSNDYGDVGWMRSIARIDKLTPRQREVLMLLGTGMSTRQIAARMLVTEHTVKAHTTRILEVLGLESRLQAGLAALAYQTGALARRADG